MVPLGGFDRGCRRKTGAEGDAALLPDGEEATKRDLILNELGVSLKR